MRLSPHRHTLAVLRTTIGLTQKQMAELAECSPPTIQAIELGKLKMSDRIAKLLLFNTGISIDWLIANDTTTPPTEAISKKPYTKESFEQHRAGLFAPNRGDFRALYSLFDLWTMYARQIELYSLLLAQAYKEGTEGVFAYKCMMRTLETGHQIKHMPGVSRKLLAQTPEVSYERINDASGFVTQFAEDTYSHFRHALNASGKTPDADLKRIIKNFDKLLNFRDSTSRKSKS